MSSSPVSDRVRNRFSQRRESVKGTPPLNSKTADPDYEDGDDRSTDRLGPRRRSNSISGSSGVDGGFAGRFSRNDTSDGASTLGRRKSEFRPSDSPIFGNGFDPFFVRGMAASSSVTDLHHAPSPDLHGFHPVVQVSGPYLIYFSFFF